MVTGRPIRKAEAIGAWAGLTQIEVGGDRDESMLGLSGNLLF